MIARKGKLDVNLPPLKREERGVIKKLAGSVFCCYLCGLTFLECRDLFQTSVLPSAKAEEHHNAVIAVLAEASRSIIPFRKVE